MKKIVRIMNICSYSETSKENVIVIIIVVILITRRTCRYVDFVKYFDPEVEGNRILFNIKFWFYLHMSVRLSAWLYEHINSLDQYQIVILCKHVCPFVPMVNILSVSKIKILVTIWKLLHWKWAKSKNCKNKLFSLFIIYTYTYKKHSRPLCEWPFSTCTKIEENRLRPFNIFIFFLILKKKKRWV